jgi:2-polyprenyl-6-methoxyphenol hydroxylase-like FAD-dependent oxidoreductase
VLWSPETSEPTDWAGKGRHGTGSEGSGPAWVPTEDVIGHSGDRQILVVGDTVVGRTTAALLGRAGYDPLLAAARNRPVESRVAVVWPPALQVLDALGAGQRVRDSGVRIAELSVRSCETPPDAETTLSRATGGRDGPPVLIGRRDLRRALAHRLPDHGTARSVDSVLRQGDGVVATFADGVTEWFDLVLDASGGGQSVGTDGRETTECPEVRQYETLVETDAAASPGLWECWHPEAFVQWLPVPEESSALLRVTTSRTDDPASLSGDLTDGRWAKEGVALDRALHDVEPTPVRQTTLPDAALAGSWWGADRIVACGTAACPVAPASGCRVSLGIEDALAFVTELTRGPQSVDAVVETYGARRVQRLKRLRRTAADARSGHAYPAPTGEGPLATLGALRTVALGPFLGSGLASLQREGFH